MSDRMQFTGTQMDIGGGNSEAQDGFGPGVTEMTGDVMPLSRGVRPMGVFSDQPMGQIQNENTGTVPLKRAPHRGYESGTPINSESKNPTGS